jgi:hypothetical protein
VTEENTQEPTEASEATDVEQEVEIDHASAAFAISACIRLLNDNLGPEFNKPKHKFKAPRRRPAYEEGKATMLKRVLAELRAAMDYHMEFVAPIYQSDAPAAEKEETDGKEGS